MPDDPVRIGLVGVGGIALTHLDAIQAVSTARLAALVEPREDVAAPISADLHVPLFASHRDPELLSLVDAVVICTPPNLHAEISEHFIVEGKHVLCEKPLAVERHQAGRMAELAETHDRVLMMASKFRFVGDIIRAKEIIESGVLGRVVSYENSFSGKVDMAGRWNSRREISGGGVIMDNGPHSVDIARYLFGPIERIHALAAPPLQDIDVEDTARLQFLTQGGVFGVADLSWTMNKMSETYVRVYGTEGVLLVGWQGSRYRLAADSDWTPFGSGYLKVEALSGQLRNFIEVIEGSATPHITIDDALASVEAIEAANRSLRNNTWVPVGEES